MCLPRWMILLASLALAASCGQEFDADAAGVPRSSRVRHLVDHAADFRALDGPLASLRALQPTVLRDPPGSLLLNRFHSVELPWPAEPGRVAVRSGDRSLEMRRERWQLGKDGGALLDAARTRWPAPTIRRATGEQRRGHFVHQEPEHLHLPPGGDCSIPVVLYEAELLVRLRARRVGTQSVIVCQLEGQAVGRIPLAGPDWREYEIRVPAEAADPIAGTATTLQLRVEADAAGLDLHWVETDRGGPDRVFVRREDATDLEIHYLPRAPRPLGEALRSSDGSWRFLAAGGPLTLRFAAHADGLRLDGQPLALVREDPSLDLDIPPGLHVLTALGELGGVTIHQPQAALLPFLHGPEGSLEDRVGDATNHPVLARISCQEDRRAALWLPAPTALEVAVELQADERLRFSAGLSDPPHLSLADPDADPRDTQFSITWQRRGQDRARSLDAFTLRATERGWRDREVRIRPQDAGHGVLRFATAAGGAAGAALADPRLITAREPDEAPPWNVILYIVDTLRADHLSCYGAARPTSPHLDALAADGYLFTHSSAVASWTRPSTATLLTGLYPRYHGANAGNALSRGNRTLAEVLRAAGYSCWGAVTNPQVSAAGLHFEQGYHRFVAPDGLEALARPADRTPTSEILNDAFLPWLERHRDEPFFACLHTLDPHSPYRRPAALKEGFARADYAGRLRGKELVPHGVLIPLTDELDADDLMHVRDVYDEEIRYQDEQLQRLLDALDELHLRERTVVVFTSDHGEEFLEHGGWDHRDRMWEELIRVPLVVWLPPGLREPLLPPGQRITSPVSQVDLLPSLVELLGVADGTPRQGESFLPLLAGAERPLREIFSEEVIRADPDALGALRSGPWKLVWENREAMPTYRLYHLEDDPGEQHDLAAAETEKVAELLARREAQRAQHRAQGFVPQDEGERAELSSAVQEALRELGYLDER